MILNHLDVENLTIIYGVGIGLLIVPFATSMTNATGMLIPTKIPAKTRPSFLSIIIYNQFYCLFNTFVSSQIWNYRSEDVEIVQELKLFD